MHLGTRLVRSPHLGLFVRRVGVTGLLALGAFVIAAPVPYRVNRRATGRIEGAVEISSSLTARRPQFRIYADPGSGSLPPAAPRYPVAAELRNVVIYLEGDSARLWSSAPSPEPRCAPRSRSATSDSCRTFAPSSKERPSTFPNEDDVFHNVFSLSAAASQSGRGFDLGRYPRGVVALRHVREARPRSSVLPHSRRYERLRMGALQPVLRVARRRSSFCDRRRSRGRLHDRWLARAHQADHQTRSRVGRTNGDDRLQHSAPTGRGNGR